MSREISQNLVEKWARENPSLGISLWLEKTKNENGNLKCKACTHFESEISGVASFKKTWIDGCTGARLVELKEHCNGKPQMKALRSFKASVLKMPAEVGQKDIDTSVSADEMERLERKANIAYFAAKNDIPFRKFQGLVELGHKEGNLNFEKDIGNLYVNKGGCREFISAHGEVTVHVAEVVSKSNFFSILMDGSTIHGKGKEGVYIRSFQREQFIKGGNPTVTQLLKLAEGVSANADELKCYLDRSFDLIKQFCGGDDMLKKFILICTDGASANIGCNDSLFTRLAEEHSHLIPFWCIVHQLELAIKDSIGDGLLHDIKE